MKSIITSPTSTKQPKRLGRGESEEPSCQKKEIHEGAARKSSKAVTSTLNRAQGKAPTIDRRQAEAGQRQREH